MQEVDDICGGGDLLDELGDHALFFPPLLEGLFLLLKVLLSLQSIGYKGDGEKKKEKKSKKRNVRPCLQLPICSERNSTVQYLPSSSPDPLAGTRGIRPAAA